MAAILSTPNDFYMAPNALNITLNALEDGNKLSVSLYAGARVMAYKEGILDYTPAFDYRTWLLQAYNTHFEDNAERYCHIALEREGDYATVVYPLTMVDFYGRPVDDNGILLDEQGNPYPVNENGEYIDAEGNVTDINPPTDGDYYYLFLGKISAVVLGERHWLTGDKPISGNLDTDKFRNEIGSNRFLSRLVEDTAQGLIHFEKGITIGNGLITWDEEHQCVLFETGTASKKFVSAYGINSDTNGGSGGGSRVSVQQDLTEGTPIARIFINDVPTTLFAPAGGASAWASITNKPFNSVGSGLTVTNGVLSANVTSLAWSNVTGKPTKLSDFTNDVVPEWALANTKPSYSFSEISGTVDFNQLPDMYWANVKVSSASKTNTTPTFQSIKIGSVTISCDTNGYLKIDKGVYSTSFVSAYGINDSERNDGVTTIYVGTSRYDASNGVIRLPAYPETGASAWSQITGKPFTSIGSGLKVESNVLKADINLSSYALKTDIPSLTGYATQTWVGQQGFLKSVAYDDLTVKPTKLQIKTILGIADWALAASKPSYTASEVGALASTHAASGVTTTKISHWDDAYDKRHTHDNKSVIDQLTQGMINVLEKLSLDSNGYVKSSVGLYSNSFVSAYGLNSSSGSGGGGGSTVSFTSTLTSGTQIGTLTIDGKSTILYAPSNHLSVVSGSTANKIWVGTTLPSSRSSDTIYIVTS